MRILGGQRQRRQGGAALSISPSWMFLGLLLWPALSAAGKTAADYYVQSLPGQPDGPLLNMHAGYVRASS